MTNTKGERGIASNRGSSGAGAALGRKCATVTAALFFGIACGAPAAEEQTEEFDSVGEALGGHSHGHGCGHDEPTRIKNNKTFRNSGGKAASFSTDGFVDLTSAFATPQGTNGRSCATCHAPADGWGLTPATAQRLFDETDGLHPLFNITDADRRSSSDVSTVEARRESFSMLLQAKFVRNGTVPATAEFECIDAQDPFEFGSCALIHNFRKAMATANFRSVPVSWDSANTQATLPLGLARQARSNITGAQQGDPATEETIDEIVSFEMNMSHAQLHVPGAGRLDAGGAEGGPEAASQQALVQGPFDLYTAWEDSHNPFRRQIARGQALFNDGDVNGRKCGGCHNAANNGENVNGTLFDVGASNAALAKSDMAIYTFRNLTTGEVRASTDIGRALRSGRWSDMDRFKTPHLRGLAARAPYFHNGIAETLHDVVHHYESSLGFDFTEAEEDDLVAFLNAL